MKRRPTLCAHAGEGVPPPPVEARPHAPPIYQTASYEYPDAAHAEQAAAGQLYIYSRNGSPSEDRLAHAIAELEGAEAALLFSSGMGAIAAALESYAGAGGHVVTVDGGYGGTHELITAVLPRFGVTHTLAPEARPDAIAAALKPDTRVVIIESISNPLLRIADVDGVATLCRARGVPLVVDATFATPILQRPLERGATLSIHSVTKYIAGHGDLTAGVASGPCAEVDKLRRLRRFHGANCDPFAAWLALRGLRTLELRLQRQVASATLIARALGEFAGVERVHHPSLAAHPDQALAARMLDGPGAMVSFEVAGGLDGARRVYDRLRLIARAASLGDVTSLMTHPARFSHFSVSAPDRLRAGIVDGLLRLSVGIEDPADLIDDLRQALS
jgi:methionine-gamma-lyase